MGAKSSCQELSLYLCTRKLGASCLMKCLDMKAEIGVATLMQNGVSTTVNGQRMSGKIGEHAALEGTSIIIPTGQAGVGTIEIDELGTTLQGGTHCHDPFVAKPKVVGSELVPFAVEVAPGGTLCLLKMLLRRVSSSIN